MKIITLSYTTPIKFHEKSKTKGYDVYKKNKILATGERGPLDGGGGSCRLLGRSILGRGLERERREEKRRKGKERKRKEKKRKNKTKQKQKQTLHPYDLKTQLL